MANFNHFLKFGAKQADIYNYVICCWSSETPLYLLKSVCNYGGVYNIPKVGNNPSLPDTFKAILIFGRI
jgi:hypothetical protein